MWQWIVDNESDKEEWAEVHSELCNEVISHYFCHACLEAGSCEYCPVKWGEGVTYCEEEGSAYLTWTLKKTKENAQAVLDTIKRTWEE